MGKCQFWINKEDKIFGCCLDGEAIARGHTLCRTHYRAILRDNLKRHRKEEEITNTLSVYKLDSTAKNLCKEELSEIPKLEEVEIFEDDGEEIKVECEDEI